MREKVLKLDLTMMPCDWERWYIDGADARSEGLSHLLLVSNQLLLVVIVQAASLSCVILGNLDSLKSSLLLLLLKVS